MDDEELVKVKNLLESFKIYLEVVDKNAPVIKHVSKKINDGRKKITCENNEPWLQTLKDLESCSLELTAALAKLNQYVHNCRQAVEKENTQNVIYFDDSPIIERRPQKKRVSADSGIGSSGSCVLYRSDLDDTRSASAIKHDDDSSREPQTATVLNDLSNPRQKNLPRKNQTTSLDFNNLNVSSLQSSSLNEEKRRDPQLEPTTTSQNESSTCTWNMQANDLSKSSATANNIPKTDVQHDYSRLQQEKEEPFETITEPHALCFLNYNWK